MKDPQRLAELFGLLHKVPSAIGRRGALQHSVRQLKFRRWTKIELILKNDNQEIEMNIKGYEIPALTKSYWDNNWLVLSCRSTIGDQAIWGEFPCFTTMELQRLQMLLEQFRKGKLASVSWNGTEPNFVITLHENRLLNIVFYAENGDNTVTFRKYATDQDVKMLIAFCADSLRRYPIREFGTK